MIFLGETAMNTLLLMYKKTPDHKPGARKYLV